MTWLLRHVLPAFDARVSAAVQSWREDVRAIHLRFVEAQRRRELSVARTTAASKAAAFQPGLFDRRAERQRDQKTASLEEAEEEARLRHAALERSSAMSPASPALLLVLMS